MKLQKVKKIQLPKGIGSLALLSGKFMAALGVSRANAPDESSKHQMISIQTC